MGADPDPAVSKDAVSTESKEQTSGEAVKKAAAEPMKASTPSMPASTIILGAFALVVAAAVLEQMGDMTPQKWVQTLYEPHVVPPPKANDQTVTIQFCQS
jgi:hypothetical protein